MELFAEPRAIEEIRKDGLPALFPASLLEQLQLKVGETVQITDPIQQYLSPVSSLGSTREGELPLFIPAKFPGKILPVNPILIPLSALESMDGSQTRFTVAHFSLDPKRNRELPQFRADMEKVMQGWDGELSFMIWDEELRIVVAQLDKNMSLLKVLYPVVMACRS